MEELPYWRVLMRREREQARWIEVAREHDDAIVEMRAILRAGREVSNRDFAMATGRASTATAGGRTARSRCTTCGGSARRWSPGASGSNGSTPLTEAVAPAWALREVDEAEADDFLARKEVAAAGLTRLNGITIAYAYGYKAVGADSTRCAIAGCRTAP